MNQKNRIVIFCLVLILTTIACNSVVPTLTPTPVPPSATQTAIPTSTPLPKPSLTPTPNAEDCFSLETLAYQNKLFKVFEKYADVSEKTIEDLKSRNIKEIQKDADIFQTIIDDLNQMKPTPLTAEFHKYFLAEITTYHEGLQLIADGKESGYAILLNGDNINRKRVELGANLDKLCYPSISTPSQSG